MTERSSHVAVLLEEAVTALAIKPAGTYLDATFGRGGHSGAILNALGEQGRLIGLDQDPAAIAVGNELAAREPRFTMLAGSFMDLQSIAKQQDLVGKLDGILMDIGVSSPQLETAERGFSFRLDGPLDMRMNPNVGMDAASWLKSAREAEIAEVLKIYGEERFAKRIAAAIVQARAEAPITRTVQLAKIIAAAHPRWEPHKHPATQSFQAIRIFINRELEALEAALSASLQVLAPEGRLVVISFHSLEDRIVKRFMRKHSQDDLPKWVPVRTTKTSALVNIIGRAVKPSEAALRDNPRARSAIMRTMEKMA
jgi:16S rRNA (cytosine1402-N4)-methyltransferase